VRWRQRDCATSAAGWRWQPEDLRSLLILQRMSGKGIFLHMMCFIFCASGWGRVLLSFFRAGKVCFCVFVVRKKCLWTPSEDGRWLQSCFELLGRNVPNHHAHSGSSHPPPTSDGCNLHHQHDGHSLVTLILHPHQASILYNSSDLAYLRHTIHYYVLLLVRSNFIQQSPHLISTLSSLWKIHTP
jgi:hypothetical protein